MNKVVNLRLDKLGRAGQAKIFKWTGPEVSGGLKNCLKLIYLKKFVLNCFVLLLSLS